MTTDIRAREFVKNYDGDTSAIRFAWNGKHGDDFDDINLTFRDAVLAQVIAEPKAASLPLLVDLYTAMTECSAEAWGIDDRVKDIARLMLNEGGADVTRIYIEGAMCSFDAHCATSVAGCAKDPIKACLNKARIELASTSNPDQKQFWQFGIERFGKLLEHAAD